MASNVARADPVPEGIQDPAREGIRRASVRALRRALMTLTYRAPNALTRRALNALEDRVCTDLSMHLVYIQDLRGPEVAAGLNGWQIFFFFKKKRE